MTTRTVEVRVGGEIFRLATTDVETGDYHWNLLWPSAVGLCEHLLEAGPGDLLGRRALELGTGVGLVGLVAACLGAHLTLNDVDDEALALASANLLSHAPGVRVELAPFDWREPPALAPFERILGSDLAYEDWQVEPLAGCLDALLAPDGIVLLADPIRATFNDLLDVLRLRGFEHRQDLRDVEVGGRRHTIGVYTIRRAHRHPR
jgi:predicted nicotinamide N-methyase